MCGVKFGCEHCGSQIGTRGRFCSISCSLKARRSHVVEKWDWFGVRRENVAMMCRTCGAFFTRSRPQPARSKNVFCDDECMKEFVRQVAITQGKKHYPQKTEHRRNKTRSFVGFTKLGKCTVCGMFCRESKATCGRKACVLANASRFMKEGRCCIVAVGNCRMCGALFAGKYRQETCSKACLRRLIKQRREARENNAYVGQNIHWSLLLERKKNCVECGVECEPQTGTYNPRAATVDHIIPISKGGLHALDNVQLMCHYCNSIKGDTVNGDMQLCLPLV